MTEKWITTRTNKAQAYHTDKTCFRIERSDNDPRRISDNAVEYHELDECADCADRNYSKGVDSSPAIDPAAGTWRYACPNDHRDIRSLQRGGFYCDSCGEEYERVRDLKTETMVTSYGSGTEARS